jgi:hypothetical protein
MGGICEVCIEMTSGSMIYIPVSLAVCSGVQELLGGDSHTDNQTSDLISLFYFLKIRKVGKK